MNANVNVSLFNFNDHDVRVVELDGEPWFVAADVCDTLGMPGYASAHTDRLAPSEKRVVRKKGRVSTSKVETLFGPKQPSLTLITESGLYKLVMRSDKPEARQFQDWVTREVLPSIRKHGGYILGQEDMTTEQFVRALTKFAGKKVAAYPKDDGLHLALSDLIAPLDQLMRSRGKRANYVPAQAKRFVTRNSPEGALSVVPMVRLIKGVRRPLPVTIVSPEALPAALTYVTGKLNGVDFRTSFMKLPDVAQLEAA